MTPTEKAKAELDRMMSWTAEPEPNLNDGVRFIRLHFLAQGADVLPLEVIHYPNPAAPNWHVRGVIPVGMTKAVKDLKEDGEPTVPEFEECLRTPRIEVEFHWVIGLGWKIDEMTPSFFGLLAEIKRARESFGPEPLNVLPLYSYQQSWASNAERDDWRVRAETAERRLEEMRRR